ncbi:MAG: TetR/AcrR family transcriptional regulator [Marmoricola sp.]
MSRANAGTKGVPRADREDQIVAAAAEVFGGQGFAATSVAVVAARAGISKPLIYSYFGSKEGLFTAALHHYGAMLADEIERIARGDSTGIERGLLTLQGIFGVLEPRPWVWRMFFDPTAPRDGEVGAAVATYTARITVLAEEGVGELMQLAGNSDPLDTAALTAVWMSVVDALVGWWLAHPAVTAAQMTDRCARLFAAAFGSFPG